MIGVSSSSRSFGALGRYLVAGRTGREEGRIVWSSARNLPTDDPELAAKIMRASAADNVRVSQPVYHLALSFDRHDLVDRVAMERVADRVLKALKLEEHQAVIVAHGDRQHPHVHILVNRVHPETGKVWDRWQDYAVIQRVLREEEQALGLRVIESSIGPTPRREQARYAALEADLEAFERVAEAAQQRYAAELEAAGGRARLTQVDAIGGRLDAAEMQLDFVFRQVYRDPADAKASFTQAADAHGVARALHQLRISPEEYGPLLSAQRSQGWGRNRESDTQARTAAVAAAGPAEDFLRAKRDLAGIAASPSARTLDGGLSNPVSAVRAFVEASVRESRDQLRILCEAQKTLPNREMLEYRLAQGLRRLSPPEFERFCRTLSGQRFTLASKLRRMARDAALGQGEGG